MAVYVPTTGARDRQKTQAWTKRKLQKNRREADAERKEEAKAEVFRLPRKYVEQGREMARMTEGCEGW